MIRLLLLVSGATLYPRDEQIGDLIVPRAWALPESLTLHPGRWAMDNGAFNGFDPGAFMRMLERFADRPGCLFVTAPDVVGDAAATLDRWGFWSRVIRGVGLPVAFVAQDGLVADRVPWDTMAALFIGGSTDYKESAEVVSLMAYAKARGIWVHWGRVNGRRRYAMAKRAGCDSFDGSGFSMYPDTRIPMVAAWEEFVEQHPRLDFEDAV